MVLQTETDLAQLHRELADLRQQLNRMRTGVMGREMLDRGAPVVALGTAARTDTAGVRTGTVNFYTSGATIFMQVYSGAAWRSVQLS